jgi:hypothetical protein
MRINVNEAMKFIKKNNSIRFKKNEGFFKVIGYNLDDCFSLGLVAITKLMKKEFENIDQVNANLNLCWQQQINMLRVEQKAHKRVSSVSYNSSILDFIPQELETNLSEEDIKEFLKFIFKKDREFFKKTLQIIDMLGNSSKNTVHSAFINKYYKKIEYIAKFKEYYDLYENM